MKSKLFLLAGLLAVGSVSNAEVKDVKFTEKTYGVCATEMTAEVKDGKIVSFSAVKGCPGNLSAISRLLPGMEVDKVIALLDDNPCSGAPVKGLSSCMDNFVEMLKYHAKGEGEGHIKELRKKQQSQKIAFSYEGHICTGCGLCDAKFS
nr:TSCPD domain-containing protein [uncultured Cetobacterium sp.]